MTHLGGAEMRVPVWLWLRPTDKGGRSTGIRSGDHAVVRIVAEGHLVMTAGRIELESVPELMPGFDARGAIMPSDPECWEIVTPGLELDLCEGERVVGKALVVGDPALTP
jgi:hypothetical protein